MFSLLCSYVDEFLVFFLLGFNYMCICIQQPKSSNFQVTHQRKRKILRKTRNTSPHSRLGIGHHAHDASTSSDGLMSSACNSNIGLWIAIVMVWGWLFMLSYMTAVVYSDNRRLETQLSKLSATSRTVPDELQRWHESSKWLEQNQTAAMAKLIEVDQKLAALNKEMLAIRNEFQQKYDDSSDHEKVFLIIYYLFTGLLSIYSTLRLQCWRKMRPTLVLSSRHFS